jgi:4'-phosphopantetheinyl transferase
MVTAKVDVHVADVTAPIDLDAALRLLRADERRQADRFRQEVDRRRFVLARALVRTLIAARLGADPSDVELAVGPHGKPRLATEARSDVRFNIAHAGDRVVVALAETTEVGVDVEPIRPLSDSLRVAGRFFHPSEYRELRRLTGPARDEAFLRLWVRKEAYVKCLGVGLSDELSAPILLAVDRGRSHRDADGRRWCVRDIDVGAGYAAAVAVAADELTLTLAPCAALGSDSVRTRSGACSTARSCG